MNETACRQNIHEQGPSHYAVMTFQPLFFSFICRLPQFFMPGMVPANGGIPVSQMPLLQPAQISPTAAGQYPALADYAAAAYGYPGVPGLEFSQAPAVTTAYGIAPPGCFYSIPPTTPLGMHYQAIPAEARLQ